jgi:hypothetical protein
MNKHCTLSFCLAVAVLTNAVAQKKDTSTPRQTVMVTAAFQPVLKKNGAKVNFSAAAPLPDSSKPVLTYNIPAQNLFFTYQPATLKPLALQPDSAMAWTNKQYIKAGYGNYSTPYLQGAFSFGDGKRSILNINAKHVSSKGNLPFQQFGKTNVGITGIFNTPDDGHEITAKIFWDNHSTYQYGFQPDTLKLSKDSLKRQYNTVGAKVGLRNKKLNSYGINYNPSLAFIYFGDNIGGKETNLIIDAPVSKNITDQFSFRLGINADLGKYKSDSADISNNIITVAPSVQYNTTDLRINAGFTPAWSQGSFHLLPNFTAEAKLPDINFMLMAGFTGYYNKTTYRALANFNPWLKQPTFLNNTKVTEIYGGLKGSAGKHMTYNAKVSFLKFNDQPLFVNDTLTGRSFDILNESSLKTLRIHGELGYTINEKISLLAGANINQYLDLNDQQEAYGLPGLELNGTLRWQILKDFSIKSDLFVWDGIHNRSRTKETSKSKAIFDMNAGVEFTILPKLNLWADFNNIFNKKYQRWNQYQVLGFNVVGGIIYSFGK